jgi:uncharacterized SAM-binding protein YcdF (DUF218 family)
VIHTRKKKLLLILSIIVLIVIFWFSAPLWLPEVGRLLVLDEIPNRADIIIVLSGDDEGQRLRHAFTLYQKGYATRILLSGGTNLWEETGIDLMERYLIKLGVASEDILSEKSSGSTVENASYSRRLMEEKGFRSAIVVTSPTHTRRVSIIFKKTFDSKFPVWVTSDPTAFQPDGWWRDPERRRPVIREYFQIGWYLLFGD